MSWASRAVGGLGRTFGRARRRVGAGWDATVGAPAATLVYHLDYVMPDNPLVDPRRAQRILNYLIREGCVTKRHLRRPRAISLAALSRVHSYAYLEEVGDMKVLERVFGEDALHIDTEALVAGQRRMVAGTLLGARLALKPWRGGRPVVNLGGGLHHARADQGAGFCLFNDVAVAIAELRAEGFTGRILVIDLDLHQGDGTRHIYADDHSVHTFSVHATAWDDEPAVAATDVALGSAIGDRAFRTAIDEQLPAVIKSVGPELVFYVAGVDIAGDDKIGSWRVTADGIMARDQRVAALIGDIPSVWLLAGGYGRDAWRHSARSLAWLLAGHDAPIPSSLDRELRHFRRISRQFTRSELTGGQGNDESDLALDLSDVMLDLAGPGSRQRFLGYYSNYAVELGFERFGVLEKLRASGYPQVELELDLSHPVGDRVRAFSADERRDLLIELVVRESISHPPFKLLSIEWLLLQNPRAQPRADRPLLPGQQHPGLGCLREIVLMHLMICERLDYDGLLFSPAHFHVASQAHGLLAFLDPIDEGRFAAIEEALAEVSLAQASRLVHGRQLVDAATGQELSWAAQPMALPVSQAFRDHLESDDYADAVTQAARALNIVRK